MKFLQGQLHMPEQLNECIHFIRYLLDIICLRILEILGFLFLI